MRKLRILYLLSVLMLAFASFSCEDENRAAVDALKEEVMALHNQDMVTWGKISGLKSSLKSRLEELDAMEADDSINMQKEEINNAIAGLEEADDAMKKWMNDYKSDNPGEKAPVEQLLTFYQEQKEKMVEVGDMIHESLEQASSLLKP